MLSIEDCSGISSFCFCGLFNEGSGSADDSDNVDRSSDNRVDGSPNCWRQRRLLSQDRRERQRR